MWTIYLDLWITRRKFYNVVLDPQGEHAFKAKLIGPCLEYLRALEIDEFEIVGDYSRWRARLERVGDRED